MTIDDAAVRKSFRGRRCEHCRAPGFDVVGHHVHTVATGRIDREWNLCALCLDCHNAHHYSGDPSTPECLALVAARLGTTAGRIVEAVRKSFRGRRCEHCRGPGFDVAGHHVHTVATGRIDRAWNLIALGNAFGCGCHVHHHNGKAPTTEECLAIVAAREGTTVARIQEAVWTLRRADKATPVAVADEIAEGILYGRPRRAARRRHASHPHRGGGDGLRTDVAGPPPVGGAPGPAADEAGGGWVAF